MTRPLPTPSSDTAAFWEGCSQGEVRYQRCHTCGQVQLIPRALCESCHGQDLHWELSCGHGVVLSFTTVFRAPLPAFKQDVPYLIALIDMQEGFRLMVNVRKIDGTLPDLKIGQSVRIGFHRIDQTTLPEAVVLS